MKKLKYLIFTLLSLAFVSLASCGDDEPKSFDSSKLEGTWRKVIDDRIMDGGIVQYKFFPENSYS